MIRKHHPTGDDITSIENTTGFEIPNWFTEVFLQVSGLETDGESSPEFRVSIVGRYFIQTMKTLGSHV